MLSERLAMIFSSNMEFQVRTKNQVKGKVMVSVDRVSRNL